MGSIWFRRASHGVVVPSKRTPRVERLVHVGIELAHELLPEGEGVLGAVEERQQLGDATMERLDVKSPRDGVCDRWRARRGGPGTRRPDDIWSDVQSSP